MKKQMIQIIFIITGLLLSFSAASAHQPTTIKMNYDLPSQSLAVWVGYYTPVRYSDYVKAIEIKVNGKTSQTYSYKSQFDSHGTVTHTYIVEAKPGDVIEVTATSTTNESKTESLIVK
jgi:hypothetical protein